MKADLFDGGHRVPTIVEWANGAGRGTCAQTVCLNDFYASFAALNHYPLKDNEAEDSYNIFPSSGIRTTCQPSGSHRAPLHPRRVCHP